MELVTLSTSGYDLDFAIMAFCGDSRSLNNFEVYVADFKTSSTTHNSNGKRNATSRYIVSY